MIKEMKICTKCKKDKKLDEFYLNYGRHFARCKLCTARISKQKTLKIKSKQAGYKKPPIKEERTYKSYLREYYGNVRAHDILRIKKLLTNKDLQQANERV